MKFYHVTCHDSCYLLVFYVFNIFFLYTAEDAGPSTSQDDTRDFCPDPTEMVTGTSDNNTSVIEHSNDFRCEELQQTSQNKADKASQFPEMMQARQGYESVGDRRKRDLRSQIIEKMDRLLENYTFIGSKGTCSFVNFQVLCQ